MAAELQDMGMAAAELVRLGEQFVEQGWIRVAMPDPAPAVAARDAMLDLLRRELSPQLSAIEDYHNFIAGDEARHTALQQQLTELFWRERFGQRICAAQMSFLTRFVGLDLHVQKYPYVRFARPGARQDNIGVHRDTQYGASPYELSVWIPYVDLDEASALRVLPGSHILPESAFDYEQKPDPVVAKGSEKHKLGFPYAPKVLLGDVERTMVPVPIRLGEMLIFSLSLVHGQSVNAGAVTRLSTDIRLVNSLAPIAWERSVHADYYEPLNASPVTAQARRYLAAGP
jgi:hypothetical protein